MKNKKARDEFEKGFLLIMAVIILYGFFFFVIYNPTIKLQQGCWTWQRTHTFFNFTLGDYNYSCDDLQNIILLELSVPEEIKSVETISCEGKFIKNKTDYFGWQSLKEDYFERCVQEK